MIDVSKYTNRRKMICDRIKLERKRADLTQDALADQLSKIIYPDGNKVIEQNTISSWENKRAFPPLDRLVALSEVFGCDIGYLLCDYDERTKETSDICAATGLSESSVTILHNLATYKSVISPQCVIDVLLDDFKDKRFDNQDLFQTGHNSIIDLIDFYLAHNSRHFLHHDRQYQVDIFGNIQETNSETSSHDNLVAIHNLPLDNSTLENVILLELQKQLIALKAKIKEKHKKEAANAQKE